MRNTQQYMQLLLHSLLTICALIAVLPLVLMAVSSVSSEADILQYGYSFWPKSFSLDAYLYLLGNLSVIAQAYGVTICTTVLGVTMNLLITTMLAYGLSRDILPWRRFFNLLVVAAMMFNGGLVPTYLMYTQTLGVKNTLWALLLPNLLMSPFNVMLAKTYFRDSMPGEMLDAATVDGAGEFRLYFHFALPMSRPMLVTIGLFAGIGYWNDWMNSLYYINKPKLFSIQSLLNRILNDLQYLQANDAAAAMAGDIALPGMSIRMAIATIALLPMIVMFAFFQKNFVKGISMGALKG